jgi:hypothetical protein
MKASSIIPESLFDKVTKSKLPDWAKTTIALCLALTPLVEILVPLIMARLFIDLVLQLLGLK